MSSLVGALPWLALLLAVLECGALRRELPWRAVGALDLLEAAGLWGAFGLLACLPAWLTLRWTAARRAAKGSRPPGGPPGGIGGSVAVPVLLGWMALPVLLHATLDRHVGLDGDFSGLARARPWLEAVAVLAAGVLALFLLTRALARFGPLRVALPALALAAGFACFPRPSENAELSPAARGPNLLLLVWDTTRSDRLEPYGYARGTSPGLAAFAQEARVFEDSLSCATFTLSSHLSLLTGTYPSTHGSRLSRPHVDEERATSVAEILRRAGWRTGAFVGTDVLAGRTAIRRGFDVYDDEVDPLVCETRAWKCLHDVQALLARHVPALRRNGRPHWFQDFQRPGTEVLALARAWIEDEDERPWFCVVNLYDAHWPYLPEGEGKALVSPYDGPVDGFFDRSDAWTKGYVPDPADRRHLSELYDGELKELDADVAAFLASLRLERGGTAVVVTADHGEAFGELGLWKHEDVIEPQVRVPLLVRLPDPAPRAGRVAAPASGVDVAPTLLALAGLAPLAGMEGVDLLVELAPDRVRFVEDRDHLAPDDVRVSLYRGKWKLVRRGLGAAARFELFDLERDPGTEHDVSAEHPGPRAELEALLKARREAFDALEGNAEPGGPPSDALDGLGYTGGNTE
jgi:arylsulfatase A-like enzyme